MTSTLSPAEVAFLKTQSRVPAIVISNAVCLTAAIIAVALRFISRHITKVSLGWDDALIFLGLCCFAGYIAASIFATHFGFGKHVIFVTDAYGLTTSLITVFVLYNATTPLIKCSILCLYIRIFPKKWLKYACLGVGFVIVAQSFAQLITSIFECVPIKSRWDPSVKGYCINEFVLVVVGSVVNVVTDFIILGLPLPVLWSLQIPVYKKRMLSFLFLVGGLACVASIVRAVYGSAIDAVDSTYDDLGGLVSSTVEMTIGIIAACTPTYKALVTMGFQGRILGTMKSRRSRDMELMSGTLDSRTRKGKGWGKITQETTIEQVLQSKGPEDEDETFGIVNTIGSREPSHVPGFKENV